jgi:hypothetical protein
MYNICHCPEIMRYSRVAMPLPANMHYGNAKETLRKAFTDHAVYTKFVITDIVEALPNLATDIDRLVKNQEEIGHIFSVSIGSEKGIELANLLKEHIRLAGESVKAIKSGVDANTTFLEQAETVGQFLSSLNPEKLPLASTKEAFKKHSQYVIDIATAQKTVLCTML